MPGPKTSYSAPWPHGGSTYIPQWRTIALGLLLVLATLAVYYPVHRHPFVNYDDEGYVVKNSAIQGGLSGQSFAWAFTTFHEANWHPLTWLSHTLDYQLFGSNPAGHHDVNLLLHVLNGLLLYFVLLRVTGSAGPSFMVAALFALHPLNVGTVAWIAERKNLLSMLFFLLALLAYGWYAKRPCIARYATVFLLFGFGLMAKPQIVTLPFVLLLWDYWPLRRLASPEGDVSQRRTLPWLVAEKLPLLGLSTASAIVTLKAEHAGGAVTSLVQHPLSARIGNAIVSYTIYIARVLRPWRLAPLYPYPVTPYPAVQVAGAGLLLLGISAFVLVLRRHRYFSVGWLWFLGTLVPMIGLVQVGSQATADRYMYLPCIGLFLMICWGAAECARRVSLPRVAVPVISVAVLLALAVIARRQLDFWGDNVTLWSHTVEVTPANYIAEDNLGAALLDRGELEEAMQHFETAAAIAPNDPTSLYKVAMYEQRQRRWPEALDHYQKLLGVTDHGGMRAAVLTNLGYVYRSLGDLSNAKASWQQAVDLDPGSARGWIGLGIVAQKSGDLNSAIDDYSHGVGVQSSDVGYLLLAQALEKSGAKEAAAMARQNAQAASHDLPSAQQVADNLLR